MEAEQLKAGDKVYFKKNPAWGRNITYKISEVERLTKTQAILKNGVRLINQPKKTLYKPSIKYQEYGDSFSEWMILTPEIGLEAKIEKERQDIDHWFCSHQFTDEQKKQVWELFSGK